MAPITCCNSVRTAPFRPVPNSASTMTSPSREQLRGKRPQLATTRLEVLEGLARIAAQFFRHDCCQRCDGEASRLGEARQHITIPAVVTPAAYNDDAVSHRPARAQVTQRSLARPLHERVTRNALRLDRVSIQRANLSRGVQSDGQCHAGIILTVVQHHGAEWKT